MMDAHLRPYFSANTIQLEVDAALLSKAIEANDPVCKKLYVTFSIPPSAIAKSWFVSIRTSGISCFMISHRFSTLFV
ncbi:hypothetical protein BDR07DRAFT_1396887, partial [Suillus spraguei]